jgi:hypothetical protein
MTEVMVPITTNDRPREMGSWVRKHCTNWHTFNVSKDKENNTVHIYSFTKKEDATLFILRWK